jgi:serine/threonine protein kinase
VYALYIVTEFCQNGDLLSNLLDSEKTLGWRFRIKIALEAASALNYLHENNFIHRDIKSSNILLDQNWVCKISDFGMTREAGVADAEAMRMTICGTDEYMAPELLFDEEYTKAVDVYSFGMVLLEIMKRCKIGDGFATRKPQNKFILDLDEVEAAIPGDAPKSMVVLARQCLGYDVISRPVTSDIKDWLQDLYDTTSADDVPVPAVNPLPPSFIRENLITNMPPNPLPSDTNGGVTVSQKRRSTGQVRAFLWDNHGLHQDTLYDDKVSYSLTLLLTYSLTHSLTYSLTHLLTLTYNRML